MELKFGYLRKIIYICNAKDKNCGLVNFSVKGLLLRRNALCDGPLYFEHLLFNIEEPGLGRNRPVSSPELSVISIYCFGVSATAEILFYVRHKEKGSVSPRSP